MLFSAVDQKREHRRNPSDLHERAITFVVCFSIFFEPRTLKTIPSGYLTPRIIQPISALSYLRRFPPLLPLIVGVVDMSSVGSERTDDADKCPCNLKGNKGPAGDTLCSSRLGQEPEKATRHGCNKWRNGVDPSRRQGETSQQRKITVQYWYGWLGMSRLATSVLR